jgi:hypothetical protein
LNCKSATGSARGYLQSWICDVRGSVDFVRDIAGIMNELKIHNSVGIAGTNEIPTDVYDAISKLAIPHPADDIMKKYLRKKLTDVKFLICQDELQQENNDLQNESSLPSQTNRQTNPVKPVIRHKNARIV